MDSMKTLLLNAPPERIVEPYDAPDYPHLGLGYIAAYLRREGCPVLVLDAKLARMSISETLAKIQEIRPRLIGFTAFTQEIIHVASLAKEIKERWPEIIAVIGGVHATVLPRETLEEFPWFDYAVFGEGEITLHELIRALEDATPLEQVKGLGYRVDGKVQTTEARPWNTELDDLPFPAWDLFPRASEYPITTARGCPFGCIFCTRPYGSKVRARSPQSVFAEFKETVTQYQPKSIVFRDETFGANRRRAMEVLNLIIEAGLNRGIQLDMESRVDTVDEELLTKMKEAGCTGVGFGVESGNEEILRQSGKGITLRKAREAVALAKQVGLQTSSYFILGFPNETKKTAWDTINFARKLNTDSVSIGIMMPFPKTEVERMVSRGEGGYKRISFRWSDYNKQTGAVVELEGLSRQTLVRFQILGYLMFYVCNLRFGALTGLVKSRFSQVLRMGRNLLWRQPVRSV
jgi:anaerobic magnesium-protoporphyrin IX monomethyl ester cyclase